MTGPLVFICRTGRSEAVFALADDLREEDEAQMLSSNWFPLQSSRICSDGYSPTGLQGREPAQYPQLAFAFCSPNGLCKRWNEVRFEN